MTVCNPDDLVIDEKIHTYLPHFVACDLQRDAGQSGHMGKAAVDLLELLGVAEKVPRQLQFCSLLPTPKLHDAQVRA